MKSTAKFLFRHKAKMLLAAFFIWVGQSMLSIVGHEACVSVSLLNAVGATACLV